MPVYLITSKRIGHDKEQTEWVCPDGYDFKRARSSFVEQFPKSAVIRVETVDGD